MTKIQNNDLIFGDLNTLKSGDLFGIRLLEFFILSFD
jgi:hypothetical protein